MTNRIDSNQSSSAPRTQPAPADQSSSASSDTTGPADDPSPECRDRPSDLYADRWEVGGGDADDFVARASAGSASISAAPEAGAESVSVLELQAQSVAGASSQDRFDDNPMAARLAEVLGDEEVDFEDIKYCSDTARSFGPVHRALADMSASDVAALADVVADPAGAKAFFRHALQNRDDIPDGLITDRAEHIDAAADALLEEAQSRVVANFEAQVAGRVEAIVDKASQPYEAINASGQSRRAFLGQLAELEGDAGELEQRLVGFGLDQDAAVDIAGVLAEVHGDRTAIDALLTGDAGPDRPGIHLLEAGDAYDFADDVLQEQLDDKLGVMEQLGREASNGQITHSLLTNDNFEALRQQVLAEIDGGKGGSIEQVVSRVAEEVESDQKTEELMKSGLTVLTAAGATVATAGLGGAAALGAGLATEAAGAAPDVLVAWEDVDLAEMAAQEELVMPDGTRVSMGTAGDGAADKARYNRDVTTAFAVAGMVLGAVPAAGDMYKGKPLVGDADAVGKVAKDAAKDAGLALGLESANKGAASLGGRDDG